MNCGKGRHWFVLGYLKKQNYEVTLFRAVEAGKTRSIDHVIRKKFPKLFLGIVKKTNLKNPSDVLNVQVLSNDKSEDSIKEPQTRQVKKILRFL